MTFIVIFVVLLFLSMYFKTTYKIIGSTIFAVGCTIVGCFITGSSAFTETGMHFWAVATFSISAILAWVAIPWDVV